MRTATLRLEDLKTTIINMGYVGENEHKQIRFDGKKMFDEYPNATVSLTVVPASGESYPATIERDGDYVLWTITDSDLVAEGCGEIQLTFTESPHIAKSYICRTKVMRSLVPTGDIPSGLDDFITRADALLDQVEDAFPAGGTTGQVLAKKSNDDYDTEWVDQGSGGTSDYTDLTNKPQIGGVTLTGNKTLHDLGAAAESDIPDPTSIIDDTAGDGDTNKTWSADKLADVKSEITNKYEKPTGGIPSSDMTDAVQTSLGKADSAYQKPVGGIPLSDLADNTETISGTTPSIAGVSGHRYICGEVATLSITAPASGCIDVLFESGSTATVLTVTSAKTGVSAIKWANGFDPTDLEANTTYELNILDGEFGVVGSWT